jgi:YYY domain-containing protein
MVEEKLVAPRRLTDYFDSARSTLNPYNKGDTSSFVYGTLPMLLARAVGAVVHLSGYDGTYRVGRSLSAFFDLAAVWLVYLIARRFAGRGVSLVAAGFMAFCPLGIQLSHFWGAECLVTAFSAAALLGAVRIAQGKSRLGEDLATGAALGLAVACKVTGFALLAPLGVAILIRRLREGLPQGALRYVARLARIAAEFLLVVAAAAVAIRIAQPHAFAGPSPFSFRLDPRYIQDLKNLSNMGKSFAGFPPMLQWAGRSLLFPLRNFTFWGAGPFFGLPALAALVWAPIEALRRKAFPLLPLWVHAVVVFVYHGTSNVKTIRYFYPAYPALAVLAALALAALAARAGKGASAGALFRRLLPAAAVAGSLLCGFAFSSIYRHPNTRGEASRWIYDHVPPPARFLNEEWDDGLPFSAPDHDVAAYSGPALNLYGPDNAKKVETIVGALEKADWIAITSNRAYGSITRLPDVFPMTTAYYRALFDGRLGFDRMANFASYPRLGPIQIPDDTAEETFTVYDHPRVLLFRRAKDFSAMRARRMLTAALPSTPITMDEWQLLPRSRQRVAPALIPPRGKGPEPSSAPDSRELPLASLGAALLFYLAVLLVGALAFPVTYALFPKLEDRGAGLARVFGLVIVTYVFSLAVHWRVFANGRGAAVVSLLLLAACSALVLTRRGAEILAFCRERRRQLLQGEAVFAAGFVLFAGLRAVNPEIFWGEKPMDFSILNILVRTPTLPASDPWFAGAPLGYYTFGQEMIAFVTLLTGLSTAFTFNLAFGWLGGATFQGAFSLARNWAGTLRAAIAGASFVGLLGNLGGLREWLIGQPARGEARHLDWHYFWATSRVIKDTINEYPFWSMTFADLHAHVLAMPLLLFVLACALACVRTHADPASRLSARVGSALLLGFAAATEVLTNAWDAPLLAGLLLLTFFVCAFEPGRFSPRETLRAMPSFAAAAVATVLLVLPLWASGGGPPGFGRNAEAVPRGVDVMTHFGFFFFLAIVWWLVATYRSLIENGWPRPIATGMLLILGAALAFVGFFSPNLFCAAGILLFVFAAVRMAQASEDRLAFGLVAAGFALVFFTQRYFIYDRMNTFFKLYFETWIVLSVATAVLVFRSSERRGAFGQWARPLRAAFWVLVAAALFTTVTAARGAVGGGRPVFADVTSNPGPTLDGLAYRERAQPGEFRAVLWLRRNLRGTPVILEAQGPSYQEFSRISMLTGLPTLLGWEYHVQQRGNPPEEIAARREAVRFIYSSPNADAIEGLLRRYHVGYVYVGWLEKKTYPKEGLKKFDSSGELFQIAYENPEVKIYRVVGGDSQDVILPAKESLPPPAEQAKKAAEEKEEPPSIRDTPVEGQPPFSGMREPRDAAVDEKGRVWVADFGHSRLRIFDGEGGYLGGWGGRGDGTYGFRELCGVAIRGEDVYVADTWNGRVQYFTLSGEWKATASELYGPRGVAVAPDGNVWVADTGNNRLMLYDSQLGNPRPIGKKGSGPGEFAGPIGIAVGPSGSVYVADTGNRRVQVLDSSGRFQRALPVVGWTDAIEPHVEVDEDETVFVSIPPADAVQQYDSAGAPGERWTVDPGGQKFARPTGLAIDRKNRMLYVVNSGNNTISKMSLPKRKKR